MVWPFSSSERTAEETEKRDTMAAAKDDFANSSISKDVRRRKLMEAINENCALQSAALLECQDSWSLWSRMTLCQASQSNYMDCLNTQRVTVPSFTSVSGVSLVGVIDCCAWWAKVLMWCRLCCCRWGLGGRGIVLRMMS
jgi:hypothetical protein